jgi:hypothetical protein
VPHWVLGSINLVVSAAVVGFLLVGPRLVDTRLDSLEILFPFFLLAGILCSAWYLISCRRQSRVFSLVAWLTLAICAGFTVFAVIGFRGA